MNNVHDHCYYAEAVYMAQQKQASDTATPVVFHYVAY